MKKLISLYFLIFALSIPSPVSAWDVGSWAGVRKISGDLAVTVGALGTSSADGLALVNPTPAAAGLQQISPRTRWSGKGWKTDATAASQPVDWIVELVPVQGAANPQARLDFNYQINAGGYMTALSLLNNNIGINTTSFGASLAKGVSLGAGTDATTNPADVVQVVVKDFAAGDARIYVASEAASSSRVVLGNGIRIGTNNGDGLVFDSLGTANKGIDQSGSGLSGTGDYWIYNSSSSFWRADNNIEASIVTGTSSVKGGDVFTGNGGTYYGGANTNIRAYLDSAAAVVIGAVSLGTLTACTSNATTTITKTAHGLSLAAGDLVHITGATTAADKGFYRLISSTVNTLVVDRALTGSDTDVALTVYKDVIGIFATDGINGQRIMNYSHQNKPLQLGGDKLVATTGLTGEDVTLGGVLNVDVSADRVSIGTGTFPTATTKVAVFDSTQLAARVGLTGQEYYQAANTSTDGLALVLGVNRASNRQLWIGDTAALAQNTTNTVMRFMVGGTGMPTMDAVATDGTTTKVFALGNASGIQYGKALVALGGGAAPTLGTIGGSGPTVAAQNAWAQIKDSTGADVWVPVWK